MSHETPTRRAVLAASLATLGGSLGQDRVLADGEKPAAPPPDTPRELKPTGADLGSLYPELAKLAEANRYASSFLGGGFRSHEDFRAASRARILDLLLYRPEKVDPRPDVLERVDRGDHIREKIVFSTSPQFRVPAYVLLPKKLKGRAPAIVDLHSHGGMFLFGKEKVIDLGNNHPAMVPYHEHNYDSRPTATALVRRGYVVIVIDALMFGERRVLLDADRKSGWDRARYTLDDVKHLNQQCRAKESTLVKALVLAGATWPGIVFWDDMRTVDYLLTRPRWTPNGLVASASRWAATAPFTCRPWTTASRRGALPASCPRSSRWSRPTSTRIRGSTSCRACTVSWTCPTWPRWLLRGPCSCSSAHQDRLFPPVGMKEAVERVAAVYDRAGFKDGFTGRFYDVPHQFTRTMQDDAFAWFDEHLVRKSR